MIKFAPIYLLISLTLIGCEQQTQSEIIPENAIKIDDSLYMIPLIERVDDCPAYSAFSPGGMAVEVIFYKQTDGSFSPTRENAVCE